MPHIQAVYSGKSIQGTGCVTKSKRLRNQERVAESQLCELQPEGQYTAVPASMELSLSLEAAMPFSSDGHRPVLTRPVRSKRRTAHLMMSLFLITALPLSSGCGEDRSGSDNERSGEEILQLIQAEIQGDDKQGNGIRDDVEQWIDHNFGSVPDHRAALRQLAKDYQAALMATGQGKLSLEASASIIQSIRCMKHFFGEASEQTLLQLKAVVLNSDVRVRAWLKAHQQLEDSGAKVDLSPSGGACRFQT